MVLIVLLIAWAWSTKINIISPPDSAVSTVPAHTSALGFIHGGANRGSDTRLFYSPVLFALPDAAGFSAPLLRDEMMPEAKPGHTDNLPVYIRQPDKIPPAKFGETSRTLSDLVKSSRLREIPHMASVPSDDNIGADTSAQPWFAFWQDQPGDPVADVDFASLELPAGAVSWQAIIFVCANEAGQVERLVIEKPAPDAVMNEQMGRYLRGVRFPDTNGEFCRRLVVRYRPAMMQEGS